MQSIFELLNESGPLRRAIPGFAPRLQQQEMAQEIADAIKFGDVLVAEAGTGTGKTVAYLVPALLSGKKVIISTGTKNLQDQLYFRDLPQVRDALGVSASTALLKGRANYACLYRFDSFLSEGRMDKQQVNHARVIESWLQHSKSGDIAECSDVDESARIWSHATSTTENCLGNECPRIGDCYVAKARKRAQEADILVINHHLFFADLALRDEGFGEILPGAEVFIFDEAHQLADIATQFFGLSLSSRQLHELAKDALGEMLRDADAVDIQVITTQLEHASNEFRLLLGTSDRRAPWNELQHDRSLIKGLSGLRDALQNLERVLKQNADRSGGIEKCWQRSRLQISRLEVFLDDENTLAAPNHFDDNSDPYVRWFETRQRGYILHMSPTSIAKTFHQFVAEREAAWVFTSATLAVGENFEHFTTNLGIEHAHTRKWQSPFDYATQCLLYLPDGLPLPNAPGYTQSVINSAVPVINACRGRTFVLVTSYRALEQVAFQLEAELEYPILVQGRSSRTELLNQFRTLGNAVLVGTSSFWEGVDVKGSALSCVIIDKLPFASPDDPMLQARIDILKQQGRNAFFDYQVPEAVITLKQGVGRLIRDVDDHGVLMLCDPRILGKSYGKIFLRNLPKIPITRRLTDIENFFDALNMVEVVS